MAKKKSNSKKTVQEPMMEKIAGTLGHITGELIVAKNNLVGMAGGAINSVKETIQQITARKKPVVKKAVKKAVKATVKKVASPKKAVKKTAGKVSTPKKAVKKVVKAAVKKAAPAKKAIKVVKKAAKKISGKK